MKFFNTVKNTISLALLFMYNVSRLASRLERQWRAKCLCKIHRISFFANVLLKLQWKSLPKYTMSDHWPVIILPTLLVPMPQNMLGNQNNALIFKGVAVPRLGIRDAWKYWISYCRFPTQEWLANFYQFLAG